MSIDEEFKKLPRQLQGIAEQNYSVCQEDVNEIWEICVMHMICLHEKEQAEALLERAWWAGHNEGYRTTFEEWKSQTGGGE